MTTNQINANCDLCELSQSCRKVCLGSDGAQSKVDVLFVGGAPGEQDDAAGKVFSGQPGRYLRHAISSYGIDKYRVALTMAVKCAPPADESPKVKHVKACSTYLDAEIARMKPRFIVPLGNVALRALTGKTGVTKFVGRHLEHPSGAIISPMLDPAALVYDEARTLPIFEAGFEMLSRSLRGQAATTKQFMRVDFDTFLELLAGLRAKPFAIDFETGPTVDDPLGAYQGNPHFAEIDCVAIAWGKGDNDVAWCAWPTEPARRRRLLATLRSTLECPATTMIAHNAVFETKWLLNRFRASREFRWQIEDTILFHHLLDENQKHGLEVLAAQHTDMGGYDNEVALLLAEGKTHHQIWLEQPDTLGRYCAGDALATFKAWTVLRPRVFTDDGLRHVWSTISQDAIFSVAWSELAGRKIDFDTLARLRKKWTRESDEALAAVCDDDLVKRYEKRREAEGKPLVDGFNPGSPQQVGTILFKILRIPVLGATKTGQPSIKAELIEPFKKDNPWIADYLAWKGRQKALEKLTEVEGLTGPDCFLYGSYLIHGTVTGRLSSSNPNLQNFSPEARQIVVPRDPDGVIVEADYSQLELRVIAHMAGCGPLIEAFAEGLDPHAVTASRMFRVAVEAVTKEQRQYGKVANFLLAYGGGSKRLRISGGLTAQEADEVYELFHAAYPELKAYLRKMERLCRGSGSVRSMVGRLRRLPDIHSSETGVRYAAAREAGNSPVQGTASDLNTWAYNRALVLLAKHKKRTLGLGPTHDSGAYDGPKAEVPWLAGMLSHVMTVEAPKAVCPEIALPFEIEVKVGPSWGALKAYDGRVLQWGATLVDRVA